MFCVTNIYTFRKKNPLAEWGPYSSLTHCMYSLAGLDGPAGGQRAAAAKPESSSDAEKRNLGCAPWSATSAAAMRIVPPSVKRTAAGAAKPKVPSQATTSASAAKPATSAVPSQASGSGQWFKDIKTPYDPAHPNDYDEWVREQEIKAKQRRLDQDLQRKLQSSNFDPLTGDEKRQATIVANEDKTKVLKLTRADFTELLGDLQEVIKFNFNQKVLLRLRTELNA